MCRKIILGIAAILLASAAVPVFAKDTADEAQIRKLLTDWARGMHDRDMTKIMAMYDRNVVAYDIVPPLQRKGYAVYRKDYEDYLAQYKGPIDVTYQDLTIAASGDVGFAFMLEHDVGVMKDGTRSDLWQRVTSCFRKIGGRWVAVHDHVSVPTDFATGKSQLALRP
ncbi:MAG TPA: nuclear transport factor 2 family protein [Rhizomicrobium sp.]|nr:nuclear transport factor 2 family protein [Rhizomicrobium sp.]